LQRVLTNPPPARFILVCFALREEGKFFSAPRSSAAVVRVLITGVGRKNAARAFEHALAESVPDLVLTCGFAGGLRPGLPVGAVVYSEDEGAGLGPRLSKLGAAPVKFCCSDRIAATALEKRQLRAATGADAVEMESEVIRRICQEKKLASATIRAISDAAEQDLPLDFNALVDKRWELQFTRLAAALLRSPGSLPGLLRLQRQTRRAAKILGGALRELLERGAG
jgi:adenosylhomocysteine nucleosidase